MSRRITFSLLLILLILPVRGAAAAEADETTKLLVQSLEQAVGMKGTYDPAAKVFRVAVPRDDVKISIDGELLPPFMGLTTWAAIKPGRHERSMVMGDVVLMPDEINPAIDAALGAGLSVTGLHNHFLFDEPRVFFMHIGGEGKGGQLAAGVKNVLDAVRLVRATTPEPAKKFAHMPLPSATNIDAPAIDAILGMKGETKNGMYKATIGREVTMPCECIIGKEMGVTTWAALYGTSDSAAIDGDFACTYAELQSVLRALRAGKLNVTAIHNHMDGEAPRLFFVHYWSAGRPAEELARSVKGALDAQAKFKPVPGEEAPK
jgi:hypothetical protein